MSQTLEIKKGDPPKKGIDRIPFPTQYNATYLILMVKDPQSLFAYWEIDPVSTKHMRTSLGSRFKDSTPILRIYAGTAASKSGKARRWFDVDIPMKKTRFYIHVPNDNETYWGDIGIRSPQGLFCSLARSNRVQTPRKTSSPRTDEIWMDAHGKKHPRPFVLTAENQEGAGRGFSNGGPHQQKSSGRKRRIYLTDADIRAYYASIFPSLKKVLSLKRGLHAPLLKGKRGVTLFSEKQTRKVPLAQILSLGASEMALRPGASEREAPKSDFFFNMKTELIVYGSTKPDATVWLNGQEIPLSEDGRFSSRFSLPEGTLPLALTAESSDRLDQKFISTTISRAKTKNDS